MFDTLTYMQGIIIGLLISLLITFYFYSVYKAKKARSFVKSKMKLEDFIEYLKLCDVYPDLD